MLCSWKSLFFLLPESPETMPSSLCPAARGSSLQLSRPAGHSLTTDALSVSGGSPRTPSDLHIPFLGGAQLILLLRLTLSCPFCCPGAPVCISGCTVCLRVPFGASWEPLCTSQDTPYFSGCLSVHPRSLHLPFGVALCVPFSLPQSPLWAFWCPQHSPSAIQ